jgi:hypothetical protein
MAILGDYDTALSEFKDIFSNVHNYSQKYNDTASLAGGYGAKHGKPVSNNNQNDYYLLEKWN